MKIAILAATLSAASAFTPSSVKRSSSPSLSMSSEAATNKPNDASKVTPINGWVPDSSKPCYGLPGVSEPLGFFDPAGFTMDKDLGEIKRLREAEVLHGRVAMMATVGYLIGESTPTLAYGSTFPHTIANNQIPEIPGYIMLPFFLAINLAEAWRSVIGWVEPNQKGPLFQLREKYYPGDYYFDPLGFKPTDPSDFASIATKELNNGRLAMIAVAGMCVQEQVNGVGILQNLGY